MRECKLRIDMRLDEKITHAWIKKDSRVLDLGCGDGTLLASLKARGVHGLGIEIDADKITQAICRGVDIIEQDLNDGLARFADKSFDTVVMARALQAVKHPEKLLLDMLRVGLEGIVTFPNFAYWQNRAYLGIKGIMPMSDTLPYAWYDTPNIHLCTFKDFERLCDKHNIEILAQKALFNQNDSSLRTKAQSFGAILAPNLMADMAMYRVRLR